MNKKIYNEDLILNLIVNGDKVTPGNQKLLNELHQMDQATRKLQLANAGLALEMKGLNKDVPAQAARLKTLTKMFNENEKQIRMNQQAMDALRQKIGIMGMTVSQLNKYLAVLKSQLMATTDPKIAAGLRRQIDEVNTRITTMTTGAGRMSQAWTKLARDANKYSAAIGWISIVIFGVSTAVGKLIDRLTGLDRKLSEVMKTTGLTREEAARLKREFDRMPTPTKSDDLLDMAKIAGKLGIEGFENIKRFTGAVDVLYTALGQDLNLSVEETAEKVGKLVNAFRVTDQLPIDEALLRTGSLLNQLDKSSVASAGTILEYMTRLSSLGTTANYPMEQLAGLAAALETVNIPAERGSTALRNIINGLGKSADKFSRILGVSIDEYKRMVETDINGVFLKLVELTSKGDKSIIDMMESMGDFEISGVRVAEVFGALAKNLDVIRVQQDIATASFKSSASVMSEYNIIINDFKGNIDLQSKRVRLLADEFNLRLRPAAFSAYKLWVDFLYILRDMAGWLYDHSNLIKGIVSLYIMWKATAIAGFLKSIAVAIQYYTLVLMDNMKAHLAHNSILLAWQRHGIKGAIVALRQLWAVMLTNPMTAMITIAGALAGAFFLMKGKIDVVAKAMGDLQKDVISQRTEMEKLFDIAQQSPIGTDKHTASIKALNEIYGKYLPHLLTEKDGIDAVTTARKQAISALEKEIALKWQNETFSKIEEKNLDKRRLAAERLLGGLSGSRKGAAAYWLDDMTQQIMTGKNTLDPGILGQQFLVDFGLENTASRKAMQDYIELLRQMIVEKKQLDSLVTGYTGYKSVSKGGEESSGGPLETGMSKRMTEGEYTVAKDDAELRRIQAETALKNRNITKEEYDRLALQQQLAYYNELISIEKQYENESPKVLADLENRKADIRMQMRQAGMKELEKEEKDQAKARKEAMDALIEESNDGYDRLIAEQKLKFIKGELNEKEYNAAILKLEKEKWMGVKSIQEAAGADTSETELKIAEAELAIRKQTIKEMQDAAEQWLADEKLRIEKEYSGKIDQEAQYKQELLVAEITYQESLLAIRRLAGENTADIELKLHELRKQLMQENITTAEATEKELNRIYGRRNGFIAKYIALEKEIERINSDSTKTDKEKKAVVDVLTKAQQDLTEVEAVRMAQTVAADIAAANSAQEATAAILNTIRDRIQAYLAEAIAKAVAKEAGKGLLGVITATAAAAAFALLFNTLIPKFSVNSETGRVQGKTMSWISKGAETTQRAKGKYPVIGADDGQRYWADWTGNAQTGIYTKPSLIAEKGPEMVIDYPTLRKIKMNAPGLIETIYSMRASTGSANRVPQYGGGKYEAPLGVEYWNAANVGAGITSDVLERVATALESNERVMARIARWKPKIYTEQVKKDLDEWEEINNNRGL